MKLKKILQAITIMLLFIPSINAQILMDSTICYDYVQSNDSILSSLYINHYDSDGNIIFNALYNWNFYGTYAWDPVYKSEYDFDTNRNQTYNIFYNWSDVIDDWEVYSKTEYTYENNNLILQLQYEGVYNTLVNESKNVFEYNTNNQQTLEEFYVWESSINDWACSYKYEYSYNSNSDLSMKIEYNCSNSTYWTNETKIEYSYDINHNIVIETKYSWDIGNNDWVNSLRIEYSYDVNNNPIIITRNNWNTNNNEWRKYEKYEYTYDSNNNIITEIKYVDNATNEWREYSKKDKTYDSNNNLILIISYGWDEYTYQWRESSKIEYDFDSNNNIVLYISSSWNTNTEEWENIIKNEKVYNAANYLLLNIRYNWDSNINNWVGDNMYENNYDSNNIKSYSATYEWDDVIDDWQLTNKCYVANHNSSINVNEINNIVVGVYPNPTTGKLTIQANKINQIRVYNTNGTLIKTTNKNIIDLSEQAKGIYLLKIINNNAVSIHKIVLE